VPVAQSVDQSALRPYLATLNASQEIMQHV
jgi:hypothetical protein